PARDELLSEITQMRDGTAERGQAQLEEGCQSLARGAPRPASGRDRLDCLGAHAALSILCTPVAERRSLFTTGFARRVEGYNGNPQTTASGAQRLRRCLTVGDQRGQQRDDGGHAKEGEKRPDVGWLELD